MSDPVTNVEIEDVLSSIRRLVSDGDKARTRDPAPVETPQVEVPDTAFAPESMDLPSDAETHDDTKTDKLVLTPAFLVVDGGVPQSSETETQQDANDQEDGAVDDAEAQNDHNQNHDDHDGDRDENEADRDNRDDQDQDQSGADDHDDDHGADQHHDDNQHADAPLPLTDMVWDDTADKADVPSEDASDRSELVATIAELEAAISSDQSDFEPDGSEDMADTIAWPGTTAREFDSVQDAETTDAAIESETIASDPAVAPSANTENDATPENSADTAKTDPNDDLYGDDDLDGLLDVGGVQLDEDALRDLVSEVVREELTGPLGERITRNVRKLVRREIYRILSSQEFD